MNESGCNTTASGADPLDVLRVGRGTAEIGDASATTPATVAEHAKGSRGAARVSQRERFHSAASDARRIDPRRG